MENLASWSKMVESVTPTWHDVGRDLPSSRTVMKSMSAHRAELRRKRTRTSLWLSRNRTLPCPLVQSTTAADAADKTIPLSRLSVKAARRDTVANTHKKKAATRACVAASTAIVSTG